LPKINQAIFTPLAGLLSLIKFMALIIFYELITLRGSRAGAKAPGFVVESQLLSFWLLVSAIFT
jgi:hypothetical protein